MVTIALTTIWERLIAFIPNLVVAILILVIGWIVAETIAWAVDKVLRFIKLPDLFQRAQVEEIVKRSGVKNDTTGLLSSIVKWVLITVTLIAAADTLQLTQVSDFLNRVLEYVPNVVGAAAILLIGAIFAHFMSQVIKSSVRISKLGFSELVGNVTKYAILIFTFLATLDQLGVAQSLIQMIFTGIVGMLAIAGGLAFGLGGQNVAKDWLEKIKKELEG